MGNLMMIIVGYKITCIVFSCKTVTPVHNNNNSCKAITPVHNNHKKCKFDM